MSVQKWVRMEVPQPGCWASTTTLLHVHHRCLSLSTCMGLLWTDFPGFFHGDVPWSRCSSLHQHGWTVHFSTPLLLLTITCTLKSDIYIESREYFFKKRAWGTKQWRTWERVVPLAQQRGWGKSIRTAISSVLRFCTNIAPRPEVKMYWLTSTLCQLLSLSYFGCLCAPNGIKKWWLFDHCFTQVWWMWRQSFM